MQYRISTQRTVLKLRLIFNFAAVVPTVVAGAEMAIRALQLTATQLQWTMNARGGGLT